MRRQSRGGVAKTVRAWQGLGEGRGGVVKAKGELEGRGVGAKAVDLAKAVGAWQRPWGVAQAERAWTGP